MSEPKDGCVKPAAGVLIPARDPGTTAPELGTVPEKEVEKVLVQVGREAVDFEANAYIEGEGFKPVKLSDYKGQWIVLCFYPGDFTFV